MSPDTVLCIAAGFPGGTLKGREMYSQHDVKNRIQAIEDSSGSSMRKARKLIALSRDLSRFSHRLHQGAHILRGDDEIEAAERLHQTLADLTELKQEARFAAYRVLKGEAVAVPEIMLRLETAQA